LFLVVVPWLPKVIMGTAQLAFAEVLWGATGSDVTNSDVSHMTEVTTSEMYS
jgi:hypothetical protein